ncbi:MAG: UDP-N-acetylmuramyl-tripeptide synthetase, partial [Acidobacteriota bacterium]
DFGVAELDAHIFDGRLGEHPAACVINQDDEWGRKLVEELRASGKKVVTYSQTNSGCDLYAREIDISLIQGTKFLLKTPAGEIEITSPLVGRPHVYNMLAASAAAAELGYSLESIRSGLANCAGAPGRFERVPGAGDLCVVVDYAHTDDALLNTLQTARALAKGRIITVFGAGGDRDRSKRAPMGQIAGQMSDLSIITSDNPRTEDPLKIIDEIEKGIMPTGSEYLKISDRREAIYKAILSARPGDVVIIAGKGHENYQIVGHEKFHFDDREVASEALAVRNEDQ